MCLIIIPTQHFIGGFHSAGSIVAPVEQQLSISLPVALYVIIPNLTVTCLSLLSDCGNSCTSEPVNVLNENNPHATTEQAVVEVDLVSEAEKKKKRAERFGIPASLEVSVRRVL